MKHDPIASGKRKSVNLSIDTGIVASAREAGLNLSRITEDALRIETKRRREQLWREEHQAWFEEFNRRYHVEGDPLAHLEPL